MKLILALFCASFACAVAQQNGDVRLGSPDFFGRGRVEVYLDGQWGTVCYDPSKVDGQIGFAQTACQQLALQDVADVNTAKIMGVPGGDGPINLYHVSCPNTVDSFDGPQHVLRCDYQRTPEAGYTCSHDMDMALACVPLPREDLAYNSMVEITNGISQPYLSQSSGLAEVYVNGEWGPVCNMMQADGDTFCRQLGYTNAVTVENRNITSDRTAMLDSFTCSESRNCLKDCFKYPKVDAEASCDQMYSYITCTFDTSKAIDGGYGTEDICAYKPSNKGRVAGAVIGTLLILATIALVAVLVVCLFVPSCKLYKIWESKKLPTLSGLVNKGGAKYDAI